MAEPSITDIFGTGATRLANGATTSSAGLFIPDSALIAAGLATPAAATAEGHFVAIIITAKTNLTAANFSTNIDQSLVLADGFPSYTTRGTNNDLYRQAQITITMAKPDVTGTPDPDDY